MLFIFRALSTASQRENSLTSPVSKDRKLQTGYKLFVTRSARHTTSSHSDLTSKKRCWKLSSIKISRNGTRDRQGTQSIACSAMLSLQTRALCVSWGDFTPFPGKQHLLQASGCCGAKQGCFYYRNPDPWNRPRSPGSNEVCGETRQANCHDLSFPTCSPQICTFGLLSLRHQATVLKCFLSSPSLFVLLVGLFLSRAKGQAALVLIQCLWS